MKEEIKKWLIAYDHKDGRSGTVEATTEIHKSGGFDYGNGKSGGLTIDGYTFGYDLRYCREKNLHMVMIREYFGKGLVKATEV